MDLLVVLEGRFRCLRELRLPLRGQAGIQGPLAIQGVSGKGHARIQVNLGVAGVDAGHHQLAGKGHCLRGPS